VSGVGLLVTIDIQLFYDPSELMRMYLSVSLDANKVRHFGILVHMP